MEVPSWHWYRRPCWGPKAYEPRGDGKVKVKQATSLVGAGAWGGAFWGTLIGLLFFMPWLGMAAGALVGGIGGKMTDIGIDDDFLKQVGQPIQPGQSALFLLVRSATTDRILEEMQPLHPDVLRTSLSKEREDQLREAFCADPAPAATG